MSQSPTEELVLPKIRLWQKQRDFYNSQKTLRGFVAGIGSGKTRAGAIDLILRSMETPGTYGIGSPSYKVLTRATFATFRDWLVELNLWDIECFHKSEWTYRLLDSTIYFSTTTNPDYLRGPNLSGFWHDEASYSPEEAHTVAIGRLREAGRLGWYSATFTPKGKANWTYKTFVQNASPDTFLVRASTRENEFNNALFDDIVRRQYGAGSNLAAQELDAEFLDEGATLFVRSWFKVVDHAPEFERLVRFWDLAATESKPGTDPDYTVGVLIGKVKGGGWHIHDVRRFRKSPLDTKRAIQNCAEVDGKGVTLALEQEPGASGKIVVADFIRDLPEYKVHAVPSVGDKADRAMPLASQAQAGNITMTRALWNNVFLDEIEGFPTLFHDDQVDAASGGFNFIIGKRESYGIHPSMLAGKR